MTAPAQPSTQAEPDPRPRPPLDGTDATAFGDLVRFRAQDGIFLRAEHLAVMQTYAADLARAVGVATGTGVVYGFRPTISEDKQSVEVGPGLAVDPLGRPLHATEAKAVVRFADAPPLGNGGGYWVLEIARTTLPFGTEQVFGNLCDDPCSGSALQPWLAEGVVARLRPEELPELAFVPSGEKRSAVASAYFEDERRSGRPWLVPGAPTAAITPINDRPWTGVATAPSGVWVPLGVVWLDGTEPQLDVWTARREIYGRLAVDHWRTRLAMRPFNVFLAQVLQFQDQLSDLPAGLTDPPEATEVDPLLQPVQTFVQAVWDTPVKNWNDFKQLVAAFEQTSGQRAALTAGTALRDLGFRELPPAGLLPMPQGDNWQEIIRDWFPQIDVRFGDCRADHVPGAIERARDLDRIPLGEEGQTTPTVDILVPRLRADIAPLEINTDRYGWVAFVRRDIVLFSTPPPPEPEVDVVEVHYRQGALDDVIDDYQDGEPPEPTETDTTVTYERDTWNYPGEGPAASITLVDGDVEMLAVTTSQPRRPLAVLRASLFFASLVQEPNSDGGRLVRQVHAIVPDEPNDREIIVVVQRGPQPEPEPEPVPNPPPA
jgi:hypothetical protein